LTFLPRGLPRNLAALALLLAVWATGPISTCISPSVSSPHGWYLVFRV
jgi:hypothetical protein